MDNEKVGPEQARTHAGTLSQAIEALSAGPKVLGSRARDDSMNLARHLPFGDLRQ